MRVLLGIVLGAFLTVGGAYLHDTNSARLVSGAPASEQRPLVNWDVVGTQWGRLTQRARAEWTRLAG